MRFTAPARFFSVLVLSAAMLCFGACTSNNTGNTGDSGAGAPATSSCGGGSCGKACGAGACGSGG